LGPVQSLGRGDLRRGCARAEIAREVKRLVEAGEVESTPYTYMSDVSVQYHALTGMYLRLDGEMPMKGMTAQRITPGDVQATIKVVQQTLSKQIILRTGMIKETAWAEPNRGRRPPAGWLRQAMSRRRSPRRPGATSRSATECSAAQDIRPAGPLGTALLDQLLVGVVKEAWVVVHRLSTPSHTPRRVGFHPLWAFADHGAAGSGAPLTVLLTPTPDQGLGVTSTARSRRPDRPHPVSRHVPHQRVLARRGSPRGAGCPRPPCQP
jgi:hypothetical protein